jgi:hypothetical protein
VNATEILVLVGVAIAIVTTLLGGLMWVIRAQVTSMQKEFKPNGGSSVRDTLNEIRTDVREVRGKVDEHINWHLED